MTAKKSRKKKTKEPKVKVLEAAEPTGEEGIEDLRRRAGERDEYFDMMLRARADLENFSKRMDKERGRWKETAVREFVSDMLPALDALHAAVGHPEETKAASLLDGIRLMEKQLVEVFKTNGIEIVEPVPGDAFDPAFHEAVLVEPSEELEPGHIIEPLRRGFTASGTLVRAAQVKVAAEKSEEKK